MALSQKKGEEEEEIETKKKEGAWKMSSTKGDPFLKVSLMTDGFLNLYMAFTACFRKINKTKIKKKII